MTVAQLWFTAPREVEIRHRPPLTPAPGQVLVATHCSALSAGTELLVYRGQIPQSMALDAGIESLADQPTYPLQYGYACVGRVTDLGEGVATDWLNRRVFAFQPHASHFISPPEQLICVPDDIADEDAVFLANMETAVNLVHDGAPALGERVVVLGLGVVGLLLTSLLRQFPLAELNAADTLATRRALARELGVNHLVDPRQAREAQALRQRLSAVGGADLIYEVSGAPAALNEAIALSGFHSRIVVGSWYGEKSAPVWLGGEAHRNRIKIVTSQVSSIGPELSGRWHKTRRFDVAWDMLRRVRPQRWISDRLPLARAPELYRRLDQQPQQGLQALFVYAPD